MNLNTVAMRARQKRKKMTITIDSDHPFSSRLPFFQYAYNASLSAPLLSVFHDFTLYVLSNGIWALKPLEDLLHFNPLTHHEYHPPSLLPPPYSQNRLCLLRHSSSLIAIDKSTLPVQPDCVPDLKAFGKCSILSAACLPSTAPFLSPPASSFSNPPNSPTPPLLSHHHQQSYSIYTTRWYTSLTAFGKPSLYYTSAVWGRSQYTHHRLRQTLSSATSIFSDPATPLTLPLLCRHHQHFYLSSPMVYGSDRLFKILYIPSIQPSLNTDLTQVYTANWIPDLIALHLTRRFDLAMETTP